MSGDDVMDLQLKLIKLGYKGENGNAFKATGYFGTDTLAALNKYKDKVLPAGNRGSNRGLAGDTTLAYLNYSYNMHYANNLTESNSRAYATNNAKYTFNQQLSNVKSSNLPNKPVAPKPSTNMGTTVNSKGSGESASSKVMGNDNIIPIYSIVPKPTMTKEAAIDIIGNVDVNNFIGFDWFSKVYNSVEINSIPVVITYRDGDYTYSYMLGQCHPVSFFGVSIDPDDLYSYQLVFTDAPQYDYGIVFVGETSLDYMKDVTILNGTYYSPKTTIDRIGQIEAKGVDFSKFQKKVISSRTSTEGGSSSVIRYSDSNGTSFVIHEVTDASGKLLHRDFDAVRIESGQLINKK
ncbi:peptidoglycan-binding domain-containing protein [Ruminiclostridium cellulolyticum]|uniref:Peptidoglycan-binding domain 1 protein n=1 Tax=Ruminiclostridium cellulolyticum (strain ATCC 35319 / DSM 5812 / JCM 6584 / H10) TaxID=394503 RepID=B8I461_RUMCH|nr:peptidoglycan-binding domain-containing protein [Ruminiclostridium cellulolyticum]ACL76494.1 Peptidoglycan-binding domain 1 protein [Ruminiclostridium cellulolyticum H10]